MVQHWQGRKVPTERFFEQEATKIRTQSKKRGVREPLIVECVLNDREWVKTEVFEKTVLEQNGPIETNRMKGAFSLNNLWIGTARPPETLRPPQGTYGASTTPPPNSALGSSGAVITAQAALWRALYRLVSPLSLADRGSVSR